MYIYTANKKKELIKVIIITTIYVRWNEPGEKQSFGGCLYTLWPCTDLFVMCCHKKQSDTTLPNDSHSHKSSMTPLQPSPTPPIAYLRSPTCEVRV